MHPRQSEQLNPDALSGQSLKKLDDIWNQSIQLLTDRRDQLIRYQEDYEDLDNLLEDLPKKLKHQVMVPFTELAFLPGEIIHTNELMVLLGENYFVRRTVPQAKDILKRRQKKLTQQIQDVEKELEPYQQKKKVTKQYGKGKDEEEEVFDPVDIMEPVTEEASFDSNKPVIKQDLDQVFSAQQKPFDATPEQQTELFQMLEELARQEAQWEEGEGEWEEEEWEEGECEEGEDENSTQSGSIPQIVDPSDLIRAFSQISPKPQTNQSTLKPQPNQSTLKPQPNQSTLKPQTNQSTLKSQTNQSTLKPQTNQSILKPQTNQSILKPQTNQSILKPQTNQSILKSQTNQSTPKLQTQDTRDFVGEIVEKEFSQDIPQFFTPKTSSKFGKFK